MGGDDEPATGAHFGGVVSAFQDGAGADEIILGGRFERLAGAAGTDFDGSQSSIVTGGEAKPMLKSKTQWLGLGGVLTTMLTAWGQLSRDAPDVIAQIAPYAPYLLGLIFLAVMFNRYMDSRKGVH